ncbi:MAG: DUF6174 domain-containing protein [Actinomycetota bacterium]
MGRRSGAAARGSAAIICAAVVLIGCTAESVEVSEPAQSAGTPASTSTAVPLPADCGPGADGVAAASRLWDSNGPESYRLSYRHAPSLAVPWEVTVEVMGEDVVVLEPAEGSTGRGFAEELATVPALLDAIDGWTRNLDSCEISWDPELGHPISIRTWCEDCVDGSTTITAVSVTPLDDG